MPELPEVEVIVRELRSSVLGTQIRSAEVFDAKSVRPKSAREFKSMVKGKKIKAINRRGKLILAQLSDGHYLAVHLKLTGQLILANHRPPYARVKLGLSGGQDLYFNDLRKFGFVRFLTSAQEREQLEDSFRFGPEPFEENFSAPYLWRKLKASRRSVKAILLDQTMVAGLGNIYADEALYKAGIRPSRKGASVTQKEAIRLHRAIRMILKKAIALGGSSAQDYLRTDGSPGQYQEHHYVYRRTGRECKRCRGPIKRIVLAGRGTHYCVNCQL